jgi:hypothetical protein
MKLEHRLQSLELKTQFAQPGCSPTIFIVIPEASQNSTFETHAFTPTDGEIEKYLSDLKHSGQCRDCKGSCAIDWAPGGFANHTLAGGQSTASPAPKMFWMYCANAEIPILTRRIMNGERTALEK